MTEGNFGIEVWILCTVCQSDVNWLLDHKYSKRTELLYAPRWCIHRRRRARATTRMRDGSRWRSRILWRYGLWWNGWLDKSLLWYSYKRAWDSSGQTLYAKHFFVKYTKIEYQIFTNRMRWRRRRRTDCMSASWASAHWARWTKWISASVHYRRRCSRHTHQTIPGIGQQTCTIERKYKIQKKKSKKF